MLRTRPPTCGTTSRASARTCARCWRVLDFDNTISRLDESGLLFQALERFGGVDLHPDQIDNATMGTIFEELIRRFNEALNENPGEHFTPRDVVHLMVDLMLAGDDASIGGKGVVRTVYDPLLRLRWDADDCQGTRQPRPPPTTAICCGVR